MIAACRIDAAVNATDAKIALCWSTQRRVTAFCCFAFDRTVKYIAMCISACPFARISEKPNSHTHTTVLLLLWNMSGTTRVSRYQKGKTRKVKTNLDLLEQEIVSGSGICWAICKSAPHPRQPRQHPTTQFFTGRMPFLLPNQQRQSTEGMEVTFSIHFKRSDYLNWQQLYLLTGFLTGFIWNLIYDQR